MDYTISDNPKKGNDYKTIIIEMLDKASEKQLQRLYHFIKAYLGLG